MLKYTCSHSIPFYQLLLSGKMYFYNNAFTGMVPSEWGALTALEELELQENMLTGQIPQSVCILKITRGLNLEADCEICPENCCSDCVA